MCVNESVIEREALNELLSNYKKTGWNFYPKVKLVSVTGVKDSELHNLLKKGLIDRRKGLNDTLITLTESAINGICI